ncbi:MAG: hypothetical protein HYZ20_09515 [Burkholderiales bacterium]|nr:hypothetical protein [Burkholderiales bacterium]
MARTNSRDAGSEADERRCGRDRRRADRGPPRGRERRVGVEPRGPEVVEMEVSDEEWAALQRHFVRPARRR